jgi:crossover junction endodeoxyribonuclease RuvC
MRIIGVDPGTAIIGWGVVEEVGGKLTAVAYGHISTPAKMELSERLLIIEAELTKILEKWEPEESSVEELFFFNNQKTAISVAQARGVILLTLRHFHVNVVGYTPLQVKQAMTSYGKADKRQVQLMVKSVLNLEDIPKPDDVADALALAVCHTNARKMRLVRA